MVTRRKTISFITGAAAAGALAAYGIFGMQGQPAPQARNIRDILAEAGRTGLPERYIDFLEWLSEVSKNVKSGRETTIALMAESTALAIQRIERDFFLSSGINSKMDISPYPVHVSKTLSTLGVGVSVYDAVAVESFDITLFNPYFTPVADLLETFRDYTYDKFKLEDFNAEAMNLVGVYPPRESSDGGGGRVVILPFSSPTMINFYRKDVYQDAGAEPPRTWEEYLEDLKAFHKPSEGIFGTALQIGSDVGIVTEFNNFVYSYGGRLFEIGDGVVTPVMDSDEVLEALRTYAATRPYADPASISYDWDTVATAMRRGRIVHAILWQDFAWMMDDPARSTVVNKIGYKLNPAGPRGSFHQFVGDGIGLVKTGKNLLAAWLWLQWATETGTRMMLTLDNRAKVVPIRLDVLSEPVVQTALNKPEFSSVKVVKDILDMRLIAYIPPLPRANQLFFMMGKYLRSGWAGNDPRQVLREMRNEINSLGPLKY
ncbi:MAG: extracellular solute-binding protein [Candidatus Caldarchaeum sp.]